MIFYNINGTITNEYPKDLNTFFIAEDSNCTSEASHYFFPGDGIFYELDDLCVNLYDTFQNRLFDTDDLYYKYINFLPIGITKAGLDSDCCLPVEYYAKYFESDLSSAISFTSEIDTNEFNQLKYKYAYLADCHNLINTIQELLLSSRASFINFYKMLASVPVQNTVSDNYFCMCHESRITFSMLSSILITLYSCFDMLTKIAFELENLQDCSNNYPKLSSSKILFGDKKKLNIRNCQTTIFETCKEMSIVINLRHELIHNAAWEMNPKVFINMENSLIIDKCIYFPDFNEEGHLVSFKNRKRFFSKEIKINEELPTLYFNILSRIKNTLLFLLKN